MTLQPHERRGLNDGIEDAFIATAEYAAGIRTWFSIRRGVIKDLFELFYFNFAILIELTEGLEEMSEEETIAEARKWLNSCGMNQTDVDIREGLEVFTRFKQAMSTKGLISLPSRRG